MNVAIATVAKDVGTTVTGIQTAITMYTLVMAAFMITGGKIGQIIGRKRAFTIGSVIYGCGSMTTALSPSLPVLFIGWSVLEGLGAVLILPAIVSLVASNFDREARPRAYGLVASAGAVAVAAGPLIGGLFTTYASWRWVFAGEVLIVVMILVLARRMADTPGEPGVKLDLVGTALSAAGLGLFVYGILRSGSWGFVEPKPNAPEWLGLSPVIWLMTAGAVVLLLFLSWEDHLIAQGKEPLINLPRLRNPVLRGGLIAFMFQYMLQAGLFFVVPLYLSVALGLSAIATGVRLLPLSITLLLAAVGVPRLFPNVSPRLVVRVGFLALPLDREQRLVERRLRGRVPLRIGRRRKQVALKVEELELGGLADDFLGALRVHACELDHHLVRALLPDLGLRHAELVDAAAHDRLGRVHPVRGDLLALRRDRLQDDLGAALQVESQRRLLVEGRAGNGQQRSGDQRRDDEAYE